MSRQAPLDMQDPQGEFGLIDAPALPPLLNAVLAENPFEDAIAGLRARKAGAGDVFFSDDTDRARFAVILEPDVPAAKALEMVPLAMAALGDCISALVPPQVAVQFRPTLRVLVNNGIAGGIKAAISQTASDNEIPDWMVIGVETGLSRDAGLPEPGEQPDITTLDEEGCDNLDRNRFIETFARHFLTWLSIWQEDGFAPVARSWKFKDEEQNQPDMDVISTAVMIE